MAAVEDDSGAREQDRFLPIANISRIMKKALPSNAKIAKDAKETVQECVSEFISFITSEASDKCQREKRKTINGDDLLWAMATLGFDQYVEPLKLYLGKYREAEQAALAKPGGGGGGGGVDLVKKEPAMMQPVGQHQQMMPGGFQMPNFAGGMLQPGMLQPGMMGGIPPNLQHLLGQGYPQPGPQQ